MMMENGLRRKLAQQVADFYESEGAAFSSKRTWPWDLMRLFKSRLKSGDLLVDVGAGNGRLADTLPPDIRYLGVEPSSSLRKEAQQRLSFLRRQESNQIILDPRVKPEDDKKIVAGSLPKLELADGSADAVACIAVLHHIPSKEWREESISELHRILKPGGCLILTVWNLRARRFLSWKTFRFAWLRLKGIKDGEAGDMHYVWKASGHPEDRYVHAFTLRELKSLFRTDDWEVEKIGAFDKQGWLAWWQGRNLVAVVIKK